jgi:plasmid stabilization system protein ParE
VNYSFEKGAQEEFLKQISWYREKNTALSRDFSAKVKDTINRILALPEAWTRIDDEGTRRALVEKYPFAVLYQYDEASQHITIYAVMHTKREPGYWRYRLRGQ